MLFRRSAVFRSAFSELQVVGSRWTRILAKPTMTDVGPPHVQASLATPMITIIPTLHVASVRFYDRVLEYMQQAVRRNKNTVILLEGICDSDEAERMQLQEYLDIATNDSLKHAMMSKADSNTLYPPEVMKDICNELSLDYDVLRQYGETVRLQECYLKPKMAAMCGEQLRNNVDLNMAEVQKILQEESTRLAAIGESLPSSVSVSEIGAFPAVRKNRERKVANMARLQCEKWVEAEIEGEVIVPWGFFHTEAIAHYILEANKAAAAVAPSAGGEQAAAKNSVVFVEADELVARVPFDVPKELIERGQATEESASKNPSAMG